MAPSESTTAAEDRLPVLAGRSGCPINMSAELLGDRWSVVVLRDIMFGGHRRFRELLRNSMEGIASNILAARLSKLTGAGLLTRHDDPAHRQKVDYRLTEAAIQLVPVIAHLGDWGARWLPTTDELSVRARLLAAGGPAMWERFMDELRATHLHGSPAPQDGVLAELTRAYQRAAQGRASHGRATQGRDAHGRTHGRTHGRVTHGRDEQRRDA